MAEHCPTCGSLVRVVGSDEGTKHYRTCDLLAIVHDRLGGLGVDLSTFGAEHPAGSEQAVEIRWRRDYAGQISDGRSLTAATIEAALRAILDYEDEADKADEAERSG